MTFDDIGNLPTFAGSKVELDPINGKPIARYTPYYFGKKIVGYKKRNLLEKSNDC